MIEFSMQSINVKYSNIYNFIKILNGYRQFDPTRGSSYILDVLLLNTENNRNLFLLCYFKNIQLTFF